jgi:tRNA(fMet)-specific endonuclease VapC
MLDTSVAIAVGDVQSAITARFEALERVPIISVLTLVELQGGVAAATTERHKRSALFERLATTLAIQAFEERHATIYGEIVRSLGFSRARIIDRMIAAQALDIGATIATLNPRDFRDIPGLIVEDWSN